MVVATDNDAQHHELHGFAIELRQLAYTMPGGNEDPLIRLERADGKPCPAGARRELVGRPRETRPGTDPRAVMRIASADWMRLRK